MTKQQMLKKIEGIMSEEVFTEKITNVRILSNEQCWTMVNRVDDFQKLRIAHVWLDKAVDEKSISNLQYNDLMMALTYISRDMNQRRRNLRYN